ncbi:MAG: GNAT family N-acetyltransferase [Uliginosibacterium sp.]|nr:GNAT family N-acetyltransferase [Uliginosibacterium sp.]
MPYLYRRALAQDAADCVTLRGQTRENALSVEQLRAIGVTVDSWRAGIEDESLLGHVCLHAGKLAGYCFGDAASGEILVLVVLPDHEGQGIGKRLLNAVVADFHHRGHTRLFLGCSSNPASRSHGFYRHQGWVSTGQVDALGDEVLELRIGAE